MPESWIPVNAVVGSAILIDSKRIGTYTFVNENGYHYAVFYLLVSTQERNKLHLHESPFDITYWKDEMPSRCRISQTFLNIRLSLETDSAWIGCCTNWRHEPDPSLTELKIQQMLVILSRWVDKCQES